MIRVIEPARLHETAQAIRNADKIVYRHLRAGLRAAGEDTIRDIRAEIGKIPSKSGTGQVRGALQAGTRVSISVASANSAAVSLVTDPRRLPAGKRALAKAFNTERFRHPVFGHRNTWSTQPGHPYFGDTIQRNRVSMTERIMRELVHAEHEIGAW